MFILKNIILCCIYKIKENKYMHQIMFHLNTTRVDKRRQQQCCFLSHSGDTLLFITVTVIRKVFL